MKSIGRRMRSVTRGTHKRPRPLPSLLNIGASNKGLCRSESSSGHPQLGLLGDYCLTKPSSSVARGISPNFNMETISSSPGGSLSRSKRLHSGTEGVKVDDEHRLIARYVERLAGVTNNALFLDSNNQVKSGFDETQEKHHLVAELEAKNREILREIQRLRLQQQQQAVGSGGRLDFDVIVHGASTPYNSSTATPLAVELHLLRQRRDELESRMKSLQGSRRELMMQLEGLMKLLKNPLTPWSTPTSSPRSNTTAPQTMTTATSGGHSMIHAGSNHLDDSLASVSSDVQHAFSHQQHQQQQQQHHHRSASVGGGGGGGGGGGFSVHGYLRKDLFSATDSVTDAMSSLVKELNSEDSSASESEVFERTRGGGGSVMEKSLRGAHSPEKHRAKANDNHFIPDIHLPNRTSVSSGPVSFADPEGDNEEFLTAEDEDDDDETAFRQATDRLVRFDVTNELYDQNPRELIQRRHLTTDEESCHETDQESYIRTDDDDDGGNTEWEDALKRWVNR